MNWIPSLLVRLTAAAGLLAVASCSTVSGIGQDVQSAGRGISKGANKVQRQIQN